jgi:hypothetical protein
MKHCVIYSHGFGVQKDDRGLFTDIAVTLPKAKNILFDYNSVSESKNTLTVASLSQQAKKLTEIINETKVDDPDATIDIVCHSQGCVVVALAKPTGIRKVIFITPPASLSMERMLKMFGSREGARVDVDGLSSFPRRDGSNTIVPSEYWKSLHDPKPISLYKDLSKATQLVIIKAKQDEVLADTDFSKLSMSIKLIELDGNHDFTGKERQVLVATITQALS